MVFTLFSARKIAANDGAATEGQRSSRPAFTWTILCGRIVNFDSLEFTLTKP